MSKHGNAIEKLSQEKRELEAENAKLRAALEAYPEWVQEIDYGSGSDWYECQACGGRGMFNRDGKPSKQYPPTHKPGCARQSALSQGEGDE